LHHTAGNNLRAAVPEFVRSRGRSPPRSPSHSCEWCHLSLFRAFASLYWEHPPLSSESIRLSLLRASTLYWNSILSSPSICDAIALVNNMISIYLYLYYYMFL
jgi:hypothetical protein